MFMPHVAMSDIFLNLQCKVKVVVMAIVLSLTATDVATATIAMLPATPMGTNSNMPGFVYRCVKQYKILIVGPCVRDGNQSNHRDQHECSPTTQKTEICHDTNCAVIGGITLTPYMLLPLFATRFADYAGGIRVSFIQPRVF